MTLRPDIIRQQIAALRIGYPELAEDEDAWLISLESQTDLDELLRAIERKRQEANAMAGAIAINRGVLAERQERFERREQAMRDIAFKLMQAADVKKRELPEATLGIANGKPKVLILDVDRIPPAFFRVRYEPDKEKIKDAISKDFPVPGATLSNAEPHLVIRTK
jgi:hypothetical protein